MGAVVPLVFRRLGIDPAVGGFGAADHDAQRRLVSAALFWDCCVFLVGVGDGGVFSHLPAYATVDSRLTLIWSACFIAWAKS